jgi:hypothetical protein
MTTALAATSPLPTRTLRLYFIAELAGTLVLETVRHLSVSTDTDLYRIVYCLALLPIRLLACMVAWQESRGMSYGAIPLAAGLLYFAMRGTAPTVDQWIAIADGVVITTAGLALAFSAAFSRYRSIYATLAILWMLLGLFDFGYALQPFDRWSELNDSLLPMMVIGSFGWIAFRSAGRTVRVRA